MTSFAELHKTKTRPPPGWARPKISESILDHMSNTPLVRVNSIGAGTHECEILAKCEFLNAGGSVKDRIGKRMILDAEKVGRIKPGDTLIEPSSGNTGIGLAITALLRGYHMVITLPEKMSTEKMNMLKALGAEIIRTPTEAAWDAPDSHIGVAKRLHAAIPNSHILDQYTNESNPLAHYEGTAEEILYQCDGKVDMVVCGAGTGGTISGVARKLKERLGSRVTIVGVDPEGSILAEPQSLNAKGIGESYLVEGIGYDFVPKVLDRSLVDEWVKVDDAASLKMARRLIAEEGLMCGGSSGAAMHAALLVAKRLGRGQRVVVLLPDQVRNYMTKFVDDEWMVRHNLEPTSLLTKSSPLLGLLNGSSPLEWWATKTAVDLNLPSPITVPPTMACADAVEVMNTHGIDQLPVVNGDDGVVGVVTVGNLSSKILSRAISSRAPVAQLMFTQFTQVPMHTPLAAFSRIFERDAFCLVVLPTRHLAHTGSPSVSASKNVVVGVCTQVDLLKYVMASSTGDTVGDKSVGIPSGRTNDLTCAQMAWQFMKPPVPKAKPTTPPTGSGSEMLSRGSNELSCAQMAWQFMKPPVPKAKPKPAPLRLPIQALENLGSPVPSPMGGDELSCSRLAWEFMNPRSAPRPPTRAIYASPNLGTTSGTEDMPQMALSEDDKTSSQPTRFSSPRVTATTETTGMAPTKISLPQSASNVVTFAYDNDNYF